MKNKKVITLVAVVSVMGALAIGGTLAWLTSTPDEVVNTFNISTVGGNIDEDDNTSDDDEDRTQENEYDMVPGKSEMKDPTVHMNAKETTIPVYVVIEVEEEIKAGLNFADYIEYNVDADAKGVWKQIDRTDYEPVTPSTYKAGVYYCEYDPTSGDVDLDILEHIDLGGGVFDQGITYADGITNDMMKEFIKTTNADGTIEVEGLPKLTFTAHVIQKEGFNTVKEALEANPGLL